MKVLVAIDGSMFTKRMLSYIVTHDDWLGKRHRYTVIHCVAAVPHRAAAFLESTQVREFYAADAEAVFAPVRRFLAKQGIEASYVHRIGSTASNIAKLSRQGKFDLVMMGSQGRGAVTSLVLGSVATGVLSRCATPVVLIC